MKKLIIIFEALIVAICVMSVSGCASDSARAKDYCRKGDALFSQAAASRNRLNALKAEILRMAVQNDVAGLVAREADVKGMVQEINKASSELERATTEYQKVNGVKGADKYKQYASLQIEGVSKQQQALAIGKQLTEFLMGLIEAAKAGRPVNLNDSLRGVSSTVNMLDHLERELDASKLKARVYAKDNDLF